MSFGTQVSIEWTRVHRKRKIHPKNQNSLLLDEDAFEFDNEYPLYESVEYIFLDMTDSARHWAHIPFKCILIWITMSVSIYCLSPVKFIDRF